MVSNIALAWFQIQIYRVLVVIIWERVFYNIYNVLFLISRSGIRSWLNHCHRSYDTDNFAHRLCHHICQNNREMVFLRLVLLNLMFLRLLRWYRMLLRHLWFVISCKRTSCRHFVYMIFWTIYVKCIWL